MSKAQGVTQNINIQQFADIFLLLIAIQLCIYINVIQLALPLNFPRIFASSLFILRSSSSLARAFLRSEMKVVRPRMVDMLSTEKRLPGPVPLPGLRPVVVLRFRLIVGFSK